MVSKVLEIVVFLIDYMQGNSGRLPNTDELSETLETHGYSEDEIASAYTWLLQRMEQAPERYFTDFPSSTKSVRILTPSERLALTQEAYGFLVKLYENELLDQEQFEIILERATVFGPRAVTLDQVKLLASSAIMSDLADHDNIMMFDGSGPASPNFN